jgi:hypothetical protein
VLGGCRGSVEGVVGGGGGVVDLDFELEGEAMMGEMVKELMSSD